MSDEVTIWARHSGIHRASDASCWTNGVPRYGIAVKLVGKSRIIWDIPQSNLRDIDLSDFNGSIDIDMVCFYKGFICAPDAIVALWSESLTEEVPVKDYHPPPGMDFYASMAEHGYPRGAVAKTWSAAAANNWSTAAAWTPNGQPAGGDAVTFDGTSVQNCTVDVDVGANPTALASVTVAAAYTGTATVTAVQATANGWGALTVNGGTVSSTLAFAAAALQVTTLTMGGGTVSIMTTRVVFVNGAISITAGTWTSGYIQHTTAAAISSSIALTEYDLDANGTFTAGSNLTFSASSFVRGATGILAMGAYSLTHSSALNVGVSDGAGALTFTTGTLTSNGSLTVGTATLAGTVGANGAWTFACYANLTVNTTGTLSAPNASGTFGFRGATFTMSGTYTANSGTLSFNGTAAQTFSPGSQTYNNFEMSNDLSTITVSSSGTINGTTTIQPLRTLTISAGSTLTYASGSKLTKKGAINISGTLTFGKKATFIYRLPVLGSGVIILSASCFVKQESEATPIIPPIIPIENFQPRVRLSG